MESTETVLGWRGQNLIDRSGDKIGKIDEIFLDQETDRPEWVMVTTGLFGGKSNFVPIVDATASGDGVQVPFDKDQVKNSPSVDADQELSQEEEARLYSHYGMDYSESRSDTGLPEGEATGVATTTDTETRDRDTEIRDRDTVGHDTSGPTTDDAMTRSEEELRIGKTTRETGRARLRKYVTTETVTETVPVEREEIRVEREPITEANRPRATEGPAISEEEHEVVLHEEDVVAEKRAVPKERIRLDKETVVEERQVSEELRKEQIEVDGVDTASSSGDVDIDRTQRP